MSILLPQEIEKKIKVYVFDQADQQNYLSSSKIDNGKFIDSLVSDKHAGKLLESFMEKGKIRTYIKDAVLNRYTKQKKQDAKPKGLDTFFSERLGAKCSESEGAKGVTLLRCEKPTVFTHVVTVDGTYAKWETALRKALCYTAEKPFSANINNRILLHLNLFTPSHITESDKSAVRKSLQIIGAECDFYENS